MARRRMAPGRYQYGPAVYGSVLATSLVGSMFEEQASARIMTLTLVSSILIFWIAHAWSEVVGERLANGPVFDRSAIWPIAISEWPLVESGMLPAALLALAWAGLYSRQTGAVLALGASLLQLVGWGVLAGYRTRERWWNAWLVGAFDGVLGLAIVGSRSRCITERTRGRVRFATMSRLDIVVYPRDLNGAEAAFNRLGWQTLERFGDGVAEYGIVFRIPADDVRLELVTHEESSALATTVGSDTVAGLRLGVSDADAAWRAARLAGLRLDASCTEGPADAAFGRLVRTFAPGGLRVDFVQMQAQLPAGDEPPAE